MRGGLLKEPSTIQRKLIGNWPPAAAKVVDALGQRLVREVGKPVSAT